MKLTLYDDGQVS